MITQENISIVLQVATLVGIVFAVYLYFRTPQEKGEINDRLFQERLDNMQDLFINLRDNHIHTLETKLDRHIEESQNVALKGAEKMGSIEAKLDMLLKK